MKNLLLPDMICNNKRGLLSIVGAFLVQICVGSYHGTFGNLLPYFTSYMRQTNPDLTHGDLSCMFSHGGLGQGVCYLVAGLVLVPMLGERGSLLLGCIIFTLAPLLTWVCLVTSAPVSALAIVYCLLSSASFNVIVLSTLTLPVTWFPDHRGKVIGFINCGMGLGTTVFAPLQSILVNPNNIAPEVSNQTSSSVSSYFTDPSVLDNVPSLMLYLTAIYATIFTLGMFLVVGAPQEKKEEKKQSLSVKLKSAALYIYNDAARTLDFHLLWLTRFLYLVVGAGVLAHWKTFSFTQSDNDQMVSIAGGVNGIVSCLSRLLAGILIDKLGFRRLMSTFGLLLTINLVSIYFVGQHFIGLLVCIWLTYLLGFSHFTAVPAQTHRLFSGQHVSAVLGCIGLADTFSYGTLGIINTVIMTDESNPNMFLIFFLTLAGCSLISIPITWFVSDKSKMRRKESLH